VLVGSDHDEHLRTSVEKRRLTGRCQLRLDLSNLTSTSLGYVVAILLPGASVLYAASAYSSPLGRLLMELEARGSSFSLLVGFVLASATVGLLLLPARALLYEKLILRHQRLDATLIKNLTEPARLQAFRATTDESYRFHQFWGSMSFVIPVLTTTFCVRHFSHLTVPWDVAAVGTAAIAESVTIWAAIAWYCSYITRANEILNGGVIDGMATKEVGSGKKGSGQESGSG
jgi:hypothetical protein